jgi:hypothetical protein
MPKSVEEQDEEIAKLKEEIKRLRYLLRPYCKHNGAPYEFHTSFGILVVCRDCGKADKYDY